MYFSGFVSTLASQMVQARARALEARAQGRNAKAIDAVDRSIRRTLCCIVQIRDLEEVAASGFSLSMDAEGELVVRRDGRPLLSSARPAKSLLEEAGVELVPGQILLVSAELATLLVEQRAESFRPEAS